MPYNININQLYKIWFSKNPNEFLNLENQLRFIQLREKHPYPSTHISFIYSALCLSSDAKQQLYYFCEKYNIKPVDFDTDLDAATLNAFTTPSVRRANIAQQDRKLYKLAQEEIIKAIQNEGGNLAAASDIVRLLEPAIQCGIYSDFDIQLDFSKLSHKMVTSCSAILVQGAGKYLTLNNEFFGVSMDIFNTIHPDAQKKLKKLKKIIIQNYKAPQSTLYDALLKCTPSLLNIDPILSCCVNDFFEKKPNADIFQFRKHVEKLTLSNIFESLPTELSELILKKTYSKNLSEQELHLLFGRYMKNLQQTMGVKSYLSEIDTSSEGLILIKHTLYKTTVINFTGPLILRYLIDTIEDLNINFTLDGLKKFGTEIDKYVTNNSPLRHCIFSKQNISNLVESIKDATVGNKNALDMVGSYGDQSWTPLGKLKQEQREQKMNVAASIIQKTWENYKQKQSENKMELPTSTKDTAQKSKPKKPAK